MVKSPQVWCVREDWRWWREEESWGVILTERACRRLTTQCQDHKAAPDLGLEKFGAWVKHLSEIRWHCDVDRVRSSVPWSHCILGL